MERIMKYLKRGMKAERISRNIQAKLEAQTTSSSSPPQSPGLTEPSNLN